MPFTYDLNIECVSYADAVLQWKDSAVAAGVMTVVESGDGNGGNFSGLGGGDILSVADVGSGIANNINNPHAWFRGQFQSGREILYKRGSFSGGSGFIVYSASDGFTGVKYGSGAGGGGADATVGAATPPSAEDGVIITGGTNIFSTGSTLFPQFSEAGGTSDPDGRQVLHCAWGDETEGNAFYALSWYPGTRVAGPFGGMFIDVLEDVSADHVDGAVVCFLASDSLLAYQDGAASARTEYTPAGSVRAAWAWLTGTRTVAGGGGAGGATPTRTIDEEMISAYYLGFNNADNPARDFSPSGSPIPALGQVVGAHPISGNYDLFGPLHWWAGRVQQFGKYPRSDYLGRSRLFQLASVSHGTRDFSADLNWRFCNGIAIPWDGVTGDVLI